MTICFINPSSQHNFRNCFHGGILETAQCCSIPEEGSVFVCRYHVGGRGASQPQHRGGQRRGPDGQPERQRQPHGQDRSHPGQPERDSQHHGPGWGQHHGQPLRECHGELLQQVRGLLPALPVLLCMWAEAPPWCSDFCCLILVPIKRNYLWEINSSSLTDLLIFKRSCLTSRL